VNSRRPRPSGGSSQRTPNIPRLPAPTLPTACTCTSRSVASLRLVSAGAATNGVTYFFLKKLTFLVIALRKMMIGQTFSFLTVVFSTLASADVVYPVLNSTTKNYFRRVSPLDGVTMCGPGMWQAHTEDVTEVMGITLPPTLKCPMYPSNPFRIVLFGDRDWLVKKLQTHVRDRQTDGHTDMSVRSVIDQTSFLSVCHFILLGLDLLGHC